MSVDTLVEAAIRQTLGPLTINAAKDLEEGTLATRKLRTGLEFGTEAAEACAPGASSDCRRRFCQTTGKAAVRKALLGSRHVRSDFDF